MKTSLIALAAILMTLAGCGSSPAPVQFVRDEQARATKYHSLANTAKNDQAVLQQFVTEWLAVCKAKNMVLTMDSVGDPSCAAQPQPAVGAVPPAQQPDQKAVAMTGTVKTDAPPNKK